jgi:4-amino-4-deoxy-L-arabinose transferase-like glycosyltransferase
MIWIPLMDIDAAQYALISREMLERNSFLQIFENGKDYLDKPPMLFWLSAISLKIFGIHDWAYRLPSELFALLSVYSTYRFTLIYYQKTIAQLSAMVLATSQAIFLITHDVRCDTMLMGWVILSIWQLAAWYETGKWKYFFVAFVAIAGGMMTKGPIALIVPILAFVPHFILKREWKQFFRWEYLIGLLIIAILLIPMSIGLYQQYDLHPGKIIYGVPIKSGLRFYYWTQSFGRYTGENVFHEMSYFTFLLENMLWSFLPWILFFLVGLLIRFRDIILSRFWLRQNQEWISVGGFVLTYCVLARSQAQLPHYIFVVFPFAAIITAVFLHQLFFTKELRVLKIVLQSIHLFIFAILWALAIIAMRVPFKEVSTLIFILSIIGALVFILLLFFVRKWIAVPSTLVICFYTVISVNFLLSSNFYPNLLKYQMGNMAADYINQSGLPKNMIYVYGPLDSRALHFYGQHIFEHRYSSSVASLNDILIASSDSIPALKIKFPDLKLLHHGPNFSVSMLTPEFLNPATRDKGMPYYSIVDLDGKP